MMQSRTHNCNQLRIENAGEKVKLVGWMENVREVGGNLAFVVLRDFYGTTSEASRGGSGCGIPWSRRQSSTRTRPT